ncbi:MAG: hypothetical protein VZR00_01625 [Lachnospiraceae bacterium]|nr:hypothetical protein [Lachnospiraceae bacterium]MEE3460575.1 hypothetical protein [Lachnospiraceae bacterium]
MAEKGKASTRAKNKWNAKNYDRLAVVIPNEGKNFLKSFSEQEGLSVNAFVINSINEHVNKVIGRELFVKNEEGKMVLDVDESISQETAADTYSNDRSAQIKRINAYREALSRIYKKGLEDLSEDDDCSPQAPTGTESDI